MKRLTDPRLDRIARYYIERYWPSTGAFVSYMRRRLSRKDGFEPDSLGDVEQRLSALVETYQQEGLLDDRRWARSRGRALWRQGQSARMIRMKLKQKGISADLIDLALREVQQDMAEAAEGMEQADRRDLSDLVAAISYARRRRFGPVSLRDIDEAKATKQLASLARRGFSYEICQQVLNGDRDELEDLLSRR
ncbi:MAG: regulatory protein RecX [Alphaproteobacteria bacterium]